MIVVADTGPLHYLILLNYAELLHRRPPTCTVSIEIDPPSTPSTGNVTPSSCCLVPITYSSGK